MRMRPGKWQWGLLISNYCVKREPLHCKGLSKTHMFYKMQTTRELHSSRVCLSKQKNKYFFDRGDDGIQWEGSICVFKHIQSGKEINENIRSPKKKVNEDEGPREGTSPFRDPGGQIRGPETSFVKEGSPLLGSCQPNVETVQ